MCILKRHNSLRKKNPPYLQDPCTGRFDRSGQLSSLRHFDNLKVKNGRFDEEPHGIKFISTNFAKMFPIMRSFMQQWSQFTGYTILSIFWGHLLQLTVDIPYHCMIKKKPQKFHIIIQNLLTNHKFVSIKQQIEYSLCI